MRIIDVGFWAAAPEGTGGDASPMQQGKSVRPSVCVSIRVSVPPLWVS